MNPNLKRVLRWALVVVGVIAAVAVAAFVWWGMHPLGPTQAALDALVSDGAVSVTQARDGIEFVPPGAEPTSAVVFYPGGHVDARSYAPYARDLAAEGYLVVIPKMPLSLAVLSPNAADKVMSAHPGVKHWVIAGHSLGGAMAAQYATKHADKLGGIVLLAAYVPPGEDLSATKLVALTEVGTLDTVVNRANLDAGVRLLPAGSTFRTLVGGNHAQFGDYGLQPGDTPDPTMPAAEQRRIAVEGTVSVLRRAAATP